MLQSLFFPQTVFTLEGFWRLVLGIGEVFAGGRAATRSSPNPVNYYTKWTLPLQNASEMVPFLIFIDFYNRKSTLSFQIAPCIHQDFERYPPKWFSAITCAIWLRLIFRGRGSAWFFGAHLLFFHAWGRILEAGVGFWNPEVDILARGRFWSDFGIPKNIFFFLSNCPLHKPGF